MLTLSASALFAIAGLGSSLVLIPLFTFFGLDFNFAKAVGVFINGITTLSLSIQNFKHKFLPLKDIVILVLVSSVFAFLGANGTTYISQSVVELLFILFILLSLVLLLLGNIKIEHSKVKRKKLPYLFVSAIAFIGGLIGVGGGALYLPLFLYIGIKTKKSIAMTSALIPVVSFSAFFAYSSFVTIEWVLLSLLSFAAFLGALIAHSLVKKIENEKYLKIIISLLLLCEIGYMIYLQILGN